MASASSPPRSTTTSAGSGDLSAIKKRLLEDHGIRICDETLEEILEETTNYNEIVDQILEYDLRSVGVAYLPKDLASSSTLKGKNLLQIMKVRDVTIPLRRCKDEGLRDAIADEEFQMAVRTDNAARLLRLELTDGTHTFVCVEFHSMPRLFRVIPAPGSKVVVTNMAIRSGMGVISENSFRVLGGSVTSLLQEYQLSTQQEGETSAASTIPGAASTAASATTTTTTTTTATATSTTSKELDRPPPFIAFKTRAVASRSAGGVVPTSSWRRWRWRWRPQRTRWLLLQLQLCCVCPSTLHGGRSFPIQLL